MKKLLVVVLFLLLCNYINCNCQMFAPSYSPIELKKGKYLLIVYDIPDFQSSIFQKYEYKLYVVDNIDGLSNYGNLIYVLKIDVYFKVETIIKKIEKKTKEEVFDKYKIINGK